MEGVADSRMGVDRSKPAPWRAYLPGLVALIAAPALGYLLPSAMELGRSSDQRLRLLGAQVSLMDLVWLIATLALCIVAIWGRARIGHLLGPTVREALAGVERDAAASSHRTGRELPRLGASIVLGLFNLVLVLIVQGILRPPLVVVGSAWARESYVDSGFVVLVFLVALLILLRLYSAGRPLIEHLVWMGLEQVVPTAGYETPKTAPVASRASSSAAASPARPRPAEATVAAKSDGAAGSRAAAVEATVAATSSPVVAEATMAAPPEAEATVAAPPVAEATMAAPISAEAAEATMAGPLADSCEEPQTDSEGAECSVQDEGKPRPEDVSVQPEPLPAPAVTAQVEATIPDSPAVPASESSSDRDVSPADATVWNEPAPPAPVYVMDVAVQDSLTAALQEEPAVALVEDGTAAPPPQPEPRAEPERPDSPRTQWSKLRFGGGAPAGGSPVVQPAGPPPPERVEEKPSERTIWSEMTFARQPAPPAAPAKAEPSRLDEAERTAMASPTEIDQTVVGDQEKAHTDETQLGG